MVDFPKYYKQKNIQSTTPTIPLKQKKSDIQSGFDHIPLVWFPLPLSHPLHIWHAYMLSMVDFFSKYYLFSHVALDTAPYSYYWSFASKTTTRDALLKQKKQNIKLIKSLGLPWSFDQEHSTLSEDFTTRIKTIFAELVEQNIIQESYHLVYRSTQYQTTLAETDITFLPTKRKQYTARYFVSTKNNSLDLLVEHPEFIFADVAIAIHPTHKKAKLLKGQEVIIPIINKKIPIIIDDRVDFANHGGICRITPGHDQLSLAIAKDHNLPLDCYAVDEHGYFTSHAWTFAGKQVKDFFDNIIQNLSDIGNLVGVQETSALVPFCTKTGEKMIPRSIKGWFIHPSKELLDEFSTNPELAEYKFASVDSLESYRCISSNYKNGLRLPVWVDNKGQSHIIDEQAIVSGLTGSAQKNQQVIYSLLVFHLVSDGRLATTFSGEQFIDILFGPSFSKDISTLDKYLSLFSDRYPEYQKEIAELRDLSISLDQKTKPNYETTIDGILKMLDTNSILRSEKRGTYTLELEKIDKKLSVLQQSSYTFEYSFLNCLLLLESCWVFAKKPMKKMKPFFLFGEQFSWQALKCTLLAYLLHHEMPWGKSLIIPALKDKKGNTISSTSTLLDSPNTLLKTQTSDNIRLFLLLISQGEYTDIQGKLDEIHEHISTFWNCCRYIKTTLIPKTSKWVFDLKTIEIQLNKKIDTFNAFDSWILSKIQSLLQDFQDINSPKKVGLFWDKLLQFVKHDFSSKYLELIKTGSSESSHTISLLVIGILIKIFYAYIPSISKDLRTLMEFSWSIEDSIPLIWFDGLHKNYLISLFMDLVDKFSTIKQSLDLKKHAPVSTFLQSNPDFIKFTKSNEHLIKKTLHAEEILYFTHHEKYPSGYKNEEIIDITIGLKAFSVATSQNSVYSLQKKLDEKQEYLQYVRSLLSNMNASGAETKLLDQKREEIAKLKEEIDELALAINKLKIKE